MPDVVEFFHAFGINLFVGWVDISDIIYPNMHDAMFAELNDYIVNKKNATFGWKNPSFIPTGFKSAYFAKKIYWEDPSGESWHTPITALYSAKDDKFSITKGVKKVLSAKLAGISRLPIIASSYDKSAPRPGLHKAKSDETLFDFINGLSKGRVDSPLIGIDFSVIRQQECTPVIHWIDVNKTAQERPAYKEMFRNDQTVWSKYSHRLVVSDVLPSQNMVGYDHKKLTGVHPNIRHIREAMPKQAVAYICANRDADICSRLAEALVWLSTDAEMNEVGEVRSPDARYRIVYNNTSNHVITMPPGFYK